ncbi:UNVERIFIED_CONTAM: hypothetical protein Slati_1776300 [Sesamum latifolium]|uniref:Reverse transcriptase zinc-binding domain-containing protein n=1 Tax=Sesamum latifolium TaxID=2727402 RepID=A0AAW2WY10_9LAMI
MHIDLLSRVNEDGHGEVAKFLEGQPLGFYLADYNPSESSTLRMECLKKTTTIPIVVGLRRHGVKVDGGCPLCAENEDIMHNLLHCPFVRQVWVFADLPWAITSDVQGEPED